MASPDTQQPLARHTWRRRAALGVGAAAVGSIIFGSFQESSPPTGPAIPSGVSAPSMPSPTPTEKIGLAEADLWKQGYARLRTPMSVNEITMQIAERRLTETIELMGRSTNPFFQEAYRNIQRYGDEVSVKVYGAITTDEGHSAAVTQLQTKDGKPHGHIGILADEILNNTDAFLLATEIVHETVHLTRIMDIVRLNRSLPMEEILAKEKVRRDNPKLLFEEENRAYTRQAEALRYAVETGGYSLPLTSMDRELVDTHRKVNANIDHEVWVALISKLSGIKPS